MSPLGYYILALTATATLVTSTTPRSKVARASPACKDGASSNSSSSSSSSFEVTNMAWMTYQIEPNTFEEWPNGTHMSFQVANAANGAQVFCTFSELDGEVQDAAHPVWHACDDVGAVPASDEQATTATYAWLDRNATVLSLNQTWSCGGTGDAPSANFTGLASGEVHAECEDHSGETARTKMLVCSAADFALTLKVA